MVHVEPVLCGLVLELKVRLSDDGVSKHPALGVEKQSVDGS